MVGLHRAPIRRSPAHRDPVTPELRLAVFIRDGRCVAITLGEPEADCAGRLTIDHVREAPMMGKRAPSDMRHLVTVCAFHHYVGRWATSNRPALRAYLARVNDEQ